MNRIVETALFYALGAIVIVALFVGTQDYGMQTFTNALSERLEKAVHVR